MDLWRSAIVERPMDAILRAGFPVALVLTRLDRPRGRGLKVLPSPVKALATERGIAGGVDHSQSAASDLIPKLVARTGKVRKIHHFAQMVQH